MVRETVQEKAFATSPSVSYHVKRLMGGGIELYVDIEGRNYVVTGLDEAQLRRFRYVHKYKPMTAFNELKKLDGDVKIQSLAEFKAEEKYLRNPEALDKLINELEKLNPKREPKASVCYNSDISSDDALLMELITKHQEVLKEDQEVEEPISVKKSMELESWVKEKVRAGNFGEILNDNRELLALYDIKIKKMTDSFGHVGAELVLPSTGRLDYTFYLGTYKDWQLAKLITGDEYA